jgi:hypothetical protein
MGQGSIAPDNVFPSLPEINHEAAFLRGLATGDNALKA